MFFSERQKTCSAAEGYAGLPEKGLFDERGDNSRAS
jgi:hypothetical protein